MTKDELLEQRLKQLVPSVAAFYENLYGERIPTYQEILTFVATAYWLGWEECQKGIEFGTLGTYEYE